MTRAERLWLIAAAFVAALFVVFGGVALFLGDEQLSPYDPTYYGIPDRIAGFETRAVFYSGNDRCIDAGIMQIVARPIEPETTLRYDELQQFLTNLQMPDVEWDIRVVDETFNVDQLIRETEMHFNNDEACTPVDWD